jgi:hypothetical protein
MVEISASGIEPAAQCDYCQGLAPPTLNNCPTDKCRNVLHHFCGAKRAEESEGTFACLCFDCAEKGKKLFSCERCGLVPSRPQKALLLTMPGGVACRLCEPCTAGIGDAGVQSVSENESPVSRSVNGHEPNKNPSDVEVALKDSVQLVVVEVKEVEVKEEEVKDEELKQSVLSVGVDEERTTLMNMVKGAAGMTTFDLVELSRDLHEFGDCDWAQAGIDVVLQVILSRANPVQGWPTEAGIIFTAEDGSVLIGTLTDTDGDGNCLV